MQSFVPVRLKVFDGDSKGWVLSNDKTQGFLWIVQESNDIGVRPLVFQTKTEAQLWRRPATMLVMQGKSREQVEQNYLALSRS